MWTGMMLSGALVAVLLATLLSFAVARSITRPLAAITGSASSAASTRCWNAASFGAPNGRPSMKGTHSARGGRIAHWIAGDGRAVGRRRPGAALRHLAHPVGRGDRGVNVGDGLARRHRDRELGEELLALILEQVHA